MKPKWSIEDGERQEVKQKKRNRERVPGRKVCGGEAMGSKQKMESRGRWQGMWGREEQRRS